jgi:hypothetical protein
MAWRCRNCGRFNSDTGIPDCQYCADLARQIERDRELQQLRDAEMKRRIDELLARRHRND